MKWKIIIAMLVLSSTANAEITAAEQMQGIAMCAAAQSYVMMSFEQNDQPTLAAVMEDEAKKFVDHWRATWPDVEPGPFIENFMKFFRERLDSGESTWEDVVKVAEVCSKAWN